MTRGATGRYPRRHVACPCPPRAARRRPRGGRPRRAAAAQTEGPDQRPRRRHRRRRRPVGPDARRRAGAAGRRRSATKVNADLVLGAAGKPWTLKAADAKLTFDALTTAKRAIRAKAPGDVGAQALATRTLAVTRVGSPASRRKVAKAPRNATREDHAEAHLPHARRARPRAGPDGASPKQIDAALDDGVNAPRTLHTKLKKTSPAVNANDLAK